MRGATDCAPVMTSPKHPFNRKPPTRAKAPLFGLSNRWVVAKGQVTVESRRQSGRLISWGESGREWSHALLGMHISFSRATANDVPHERLPQTNGALSQLRTGEPVVFLARPQLLPSGIGPRRLWPPR